MQCPFPRSFHFTTVFVSLTNEIHGDKGLIFGLGLSQAYRTQVSCDMGNRLCTVHYLKFDKLKLPLQYLKLDREDIRLS